MRIRKIGLKAFLYKRGVSDIEILFCNCSQMSKTAVYLVIECWEIIEERWRFNAEITMSMYIRHDFDLVLKDLLMAGKVVKWILRLGYLYQYRLAIYIDRKSEELQKAEMEAVKKSRKCNIAVVWEIYNKISSTKDRIVIRKHNNIKGQIACGTDESCRWRI